MNKRNEALLELIRQGLEVSGELDARAILGNRSDYLGLSELARYGECLRAVLLAKVFPQSNSLKRLLTLQRGHWFENGLAACFRSLDLKFMSQLEIRITNGGVPIRGHLDFTLVWAEPYPAVRIVEIKSTDKLPQQPYPAHIFQAQAQVNLLTQFWNKPVFSLKDSAGVPISQNASFPQICEQNLGITLPNDPAKISVESWLLYLSMRDATCFGPYEPDEISLTDMLATGKDCWAQYSLLRQDSQATGNLPYAQGFNPLCGYCEFNLDCPKFQTDNFQPQWEEVLQRHERLKIKREALDTEIKEIEASLKQAHKLSGRNDWIGTESYRFRVTNTAGRRTLDRDALHDDIVSIFNTIGIDDIDVNYLFARNERTGAASSRLSIVPIN